MTDHSPRREATEFEARILRLLPNLERFVRVNLGAALRAREETRDIVQSVCREMLEDQAQFQERGDEAFTSWMFLHALNKIRERIRRMQTLKRGEGRDEVPLEDESMRAAAASETTPSDLALRNEAMESLESALLELPEDQRHAVTLSRIAGLDYGAVATALDRTENAVRKLVSRGLARLSSLMEGRARGKESN